MDLEKELVNAIKDLRTNMHDNHVELIKTVNDSQKETADKHATLDKRVTVSETKQKIYIGIAMGIVTFLPKLLGLWSQK